MRLLVTLAGRPGMVCGADQLLETAWGDPSGAGPDRVKYAVLRLRRKLAEAGGDEAAGALQTVRGFGYRYERPAL
jgi:DNA-binding response OmpR family regulator